MTLGQSKIVWANQICFTILPGNEKFIEVTIALEVPGDGERKTFRGRDDPLAKFRKILTLWCWLHADIWCANHEPAGGDGGTL